MKTLKVLLCSSLVLVAASAFAAGKKPVIQQADEHMSGQGYGAAGCGLGSIVFGTKPGMIQIFAATTNGTFGSQTFGITTGTSNCDASGAKSASLFIEVNKESLAKDISRGNGEALANLSEIMGCNDSNALGGKLQQNFKSIFPSTETSGTAASKAIFDVIKTDETLAKNCTRIG